MLNLKNSTTDKLQVITSSGADVDCVAIWVDTDATVTSSSDMVPDRTQTLITTATTTDIVATPGASTVRNVKHVSLRNIDASTANDVTVQYNANATIATLFKCTLAAGEELVYNEGVWFHYDSNGGVYGLGTVFASQTDMEANSSTTLVVTPGRLKYHPGVAKAVMFTTGTATPVASTPPTYNCTLTDTGVGQLTLTFTTAFSSATAYTVQVNVEIISTTLTAAANVMQGYMRFGGMTSSSSCQVNCCDRTATTNVIRDPISWHIAAFGDQ